MTLFASALELSARDHAVLKITDPYSVHRVVYSCFEDVRSTEEKRVGAPSGILFADQGVLNGSRRILMLSSRAPISSCLPAGQVETKAVPEEFLQSRPYRFQLVANPTVHRQGKDVALKTEEEIAEWFNRCSAQKGFAASFDVQRLPSLQFLGKGGRQVTLNRARLQGVLEVTDLDKLRIAFSGGIGGGKAFGCGMLQLGPLK